MNQSTKSILFLPFLQIPSGHHQVANAILEELINRNADICCEKIDILSYSYGKIESLVSNVYLKWIQLLPGTYNVIYQASVYKNLEKNKQYRLYEALFLKSMQKLIKEKKPNLIVCSHALPSYMLNYLKGINELEIPVVNIYTDYFIHHFWGIEHIDYHFVPSHFMKQYLLRKGLNSDQIFVTGIPIHKKIQKYREKRNSLKSSSSFSCLITGGNMGVGAIEELVERIGENRNIHFHVLCGKNEKLFSKLKKRNQSTITPLKYIECRKEMDELYDKSDAILTKPGGVTISECLFKRKPIFVYDALPGQEEINVKQLKKMRVIFDVRNWRKETKPVDELLYSFLMNKQIMERFEKSIDDYHKQIAIQEPYEIIEDILVRIGK
ncbi:MGDG synthase family glycosyltransferase [Calidifontibacillus oryziterrae]|uniref:MGDG synthase family glycosyltransferase n=1 Tax=Calidifontibacillus oryziterrae TaxID=1191699 RepID=UPI0002F5AC0A|nr:glycosyltransferase [Calidifontibacillus oryziterrae]